MIFLEKIVVLLKVCLTAVYLLQELKMEKKSSDLYFPDDNADLGGNSTKNGSSDPMVDAEAPLIPSNRISHLGRSNLSS